MIVADMRNNENGILKAETSWQLVCTGRGKHQVLPVRSCKQEVR